MAVADEILKIVLELPLEKQAAVMAFAQSIAGAESVHVPDGNWIGICAGDGVHITEEDIAEARREVWGNFPRDINPR